MQVIWQALSDQRWQFFITTVMSLVLGLISTWLAIKLARKDRRIVRWLTMAQAPLLSNQIQNNNHRIAVIIDGRSVSDPFMLELQIYNQSKEPIESDDFKVPIRFRFGKARVLHAEILDSNILEARISTREPCTVRIEPLLLNPQDCLTMRVWLDHFEGEIEASARIINGELRGQGRAGQTTLLDVWRNSLLYARYHRSSLIEAFLYEYQLYKDQKMPLTKSEKMRGRPTRPLKMKTSNKQK